MPQTLFLVLFVAALCAAETSDRSLPTNAPVRSMYFAAGGHSLVAACADRHIRTFDAASGKMTGDRMRPSGGALLDSTTLAEPAGPDRDAPLRIWDLTENRQLQMINGPGGSTALSSDRKQLAISSPRDRSVRLVDVVSGKQLRVLPDGLGGAASLVFSPDGATVVSANYDNDVRIWKTQSGELVRKIEDLTGAMFAAEFTPDGKQFVMGGLDETVYIFDAKTYSLSRTLKGHGETIAALAISPDGRTLVTGGFDVVTTKNPVKVVFWDLASGTITRTAHSPHQVSSLAFSPDGKWLAMAANGSKEIALFNLAP